MLTDDRRNPATILEEWRAAERQLADCLEGSADYDALAARVLELAREYRQVSGEIAADLSEADRERPPGGTADPG